MTFAVHIIYCIWIISTHTLTWSVTLYVCKLLPLFQFQLTRSRGAWRKEITSCWRTDNFNSHAHVERDALQENYIKNKKHFNSHAHVERDDSTNELTDSIKNFNSHAHVERDNHVRISFRLKRISTHTLTWSVTSTLALYHAKVGFQLTRSRGAWRVPSALITVISTFQLTRSRGAWRTDSLSAVSTVLFQLTRSRGAWPLYDVVLVLYMHFNSHAHVERDFCTKCSRRWK